MFPTKGWDMTENRADDFQIEQQQADGPVADEASDNVFENTSEDDDE